MLPFVFCVFLRLCGAVAYASSLLSPTRTSRPHLVHIVADDVGWYDLSITNDEMRTPNIQRLVDNGVLLERFYAQKECAPSRSSMLTGRLPFRYGYYQNPSDDGAIPLNYTLLPSLLKKQGYRTHAIGKWHCGFRKKEHTPTYRGFDSFFGFWHWGEEYLAHVFPPYYKDAKCRGLDLVNATGPAMVSASKLSGIFSTDAYVSEFERIVSSHPGAEPLYVYFALQNAHDPYEHVPSHLLAGYHASMDPMRRNFSALVENLDWAIGKVQNALEKAGLWENTVLFFNSDNGGELPYHDQSRCGGDCLTTSCCGGAGSNYPMRGGKFTLWEGGVRARSFVYSASTELLPQARRGQSWRGLSHVSDVFATLAGLAGADVSAAPGPDNGFLGTGLTAVSVATGRRLMRNTRYSVVEGVQTDGYDLWAAIVGDLPSPRKELVFQPLNMYWDKECKESDETNPFVPSCGASITVWPYKLYTGFPGDGRVVVPANTTLGESFHQTPRDLCVDTPCLFNLEEDEVESEDIAAKEPSIVNSLLSRLHDLSTPEAAPQPADAMTPEPSDEACSKVFASGAWLPWETAFLPEL